MSAHPYAYLMLNAPIIVIWMVFYAFLPAISRREMLFVSLLATPLATTEIIYAWDYFAPDYTFPFLKREHFGLEDVLFAWFFGGLGAVCWDVFSGQRWRRSRETHIALFYVLYISGIIGFFVFTLAFGISSTTTGSMWLVGLGCVALFMRPDLIKESLLSALMGAIIFGAIYVCIMIPIYPGVTHDWYKGSFYVLGVPFEEYEFGWTWAFYASTAYKFAVGMAQHKEET